MDSLRQRFRRARDRRKSDWLRPDATSSSSSLASSSSYVRQTNPEIIVVDVESGNQSAIDQSAIDQSTTEQSLWDEAYEGLGKEKPKLVAKYEMLLAREAAAAGEYYGKARPIRHRERRKTETNIVQPADSTSTLKEGSLARPISPHNMSLSRDGQTRRAKLNMIIQRGLQRVEEKTTKYTIAGHEFVLEDQIANAAEFVIWAKGLVDSAVEASPAASIAWSGICLVLPLLTNPKTSEEANRDGFTYVTTRMRYYAALEHLLLKLGNNPGVNSNLMAEANSHILNLYQQILDLQIESILRFYQSRLRVYVTGVFQTRNWKQMRQEIIDLEAIVNGELGQINQFTSREELEYLNKTCKEAHNTMQNLLSISQQQLSVQTDNRDISRQLLQLQKYTIEKKLSDEQKKCLHLFYLTKSNKDATYEWYKNRVEDRVQDTCMWFLKHDNFQKWLKLPAGPLLVTADPGCGKSVLAKHLIDHVLSTESATVCYFFFKDQDQNTVRQALCALLHQLFRVKPFLIEHAIRVTEEDGPQTVESTPSLWNIFTNVIRDLRAGAVVFVLDALDECDATEFKDLMSNLGDLFSDHGLSDTKIKLLMTSRPYQQVMSEFRHLLYDFPNIHIPGEEELDTISQEVNRVIHYRVGQLARREQLPESLQSHLEKRLLEVEHRTYLWVYLVFDYLETGFKKTTKGIESAIENLPESVNQAYEQILHKSRDNPMVWKVLSIVLAARRPLTVTEMNVAVNLDDQSESPLSLHELDLEDDKDFKSRLRQWCGLFISIHHNNVYFLHQTAREFLLCTHSPRASSTLLSKSMRWHHSITLNDADTLLAKLCVRYLSSMSSKSVFLPENDTCRAFSDYSAAFWPTHFRNAIIAKNDATLLLASKLCDPRSEMSTAWYTKLQWGGRKSSFVKLTLAAYLGLLSVVRLYLDSGADVHTRDNHNETMLSNAAEAGHEAVVRLLLERGADVNTGGIRTRTPLYAAVCRRNEAVVRLLLENGADAAVGEASYFTPLMEAVRGGQETIVRLLLEHEPVPTFRRCSISSIR